MNNGSFRKTKYSLNILKCKRNFYIWYAIISYVEHINIDINVQKIGRNYERKENRNRSRKYQIIF